MAKAAVLILLITGAFATGVGANILLYFQFYLLGRIYWRCTNAHVNAPHRRTIYHSIKTLTALLTVWITLMGCRGPETQQNFNVHFLYIEFPDVPRIPYTPEQYQRLLYSGDYNSILSHIHPNHANVSGGNQNTPQSLYRQTPGNKPVFGSVNEWFQYQSFGLMSVQGRFLARLPSIHTYRELRQNRVAGSGEMIQAIIDEALAVLRRNPVTIAPGEKILVIHNAERFDTTVFAAGDLAFVNGRNFEGNDIVNIGEVTHELGHLLLYQPDRYG